MSIRLTSLRAGAVALAVGGAAAAGGCATISTQQEVQAGGDYSRQINAILSAKPAEPAPTGPVAVPSPDSRNTRDRISA